MPKTVATAVLVVGMHRSGTSALAGLLGRSGISLGERLLEPGSDNPKGYFEHRDIVVIHERLLEALGSSWSDVRPLPDGWLSTEAAKRAAAAIEDVLVRDFGGQTLWAVKDPRLCRFLPLWKEVLGRMGVSPALLFIVRNPSEVAASIATRNNWQSPFGEMLWLRYMVDAIGASTQMERHVIAFDQFLADPAKVIGQALRKLGVTVTSQMEIAASTEAVNFIDGAERHHRSVGARAKKNGFAGVAHDMYCALVAMANGENASANLEKALVQFHRVWHRSPGVAAVAGLAMDFAANARAFESERYQVAEKFHAQIAWSDMAVKKHETLQAENAELSSELNAQIEWAEQAVAKHEALQAENVELASKLHAQVAWSNDAQSRIESLQRVRAAEGAKLASVMSRLHAVEGELERAQASARDLAAELRRVAGHAEHVRGAMVAQLQRSERERDRLQDDVNHMNRYTGELKIELCAIRASRSWKVTKPMRAIASWFRTKKIRSNDEKRNVE